MTDREKLSICLGKRGYEAVRLLGKGRFSEVYLVRDREGKLLACKVSQKLGLLSREAHVMEGLSHPLFPAFAEFWQEKQGFLVMEYVAGSTLEEALRRRKGFSVDATARIGMELASGLGFLHEQMELVYRDVKPSNIILSQDGRVKLVDLGCVSPLGEYPEARAGTLGFAAPEQLRAGERLTEACDVYGLGKTMEAMREGRRKGGGLWRVIAACTREERESRLPDMRSAAQELSNVGKGFRSGRKGWGADIGKGRLQVQKNIWKSGYKKA